MNDNLSVEAARAVLDHARWDSDSEPQGVGFGVCVAILMACTFVCGGVLGWVVRGLL